MSFESHAPNIANLQSYLADEKNKQTSGDGITWWSIPKGMSSVRILPPWDPSGRIALAVNMHPIEYQGKLKYKKYNWTCVNKTFGKPCKICEGLAEMSAAGVDVSKYEANKRQFYMNAIVMHDPTYDPQSGKGTAPGTHVLLKSPKTLYDWVISQITNPMVGDITSVTRGIDIYITKSGDGLGTTYTPTLSPNGWTAVPEEYLSKITNLYDLDKIFSTGFDEELIGELVSSLKKSAGVIANTVPNLVNQMAGYQSPAVAPVPVPQNTPVYPSVQYPPVSGTVTGTPYNAPQNINSQVAPPSPTTPYGMVTQPSIAPSPFSAGNAPAPVQGNSAVPPWESSSGPAYQAPSAPAPASQPSPQEMNLPKCFGNYNPAQVTCVVCPAEIPCSQKSGKR